MEKPKRGRWKTGESGNPAGRRPGTGEIGRLREGIAAELPEIIAKLVIAAKAGDTQAARLLLERVLPSIKAVGQVVTMTLPDGDDLSAQGAAIVRAVANGVIPPDQGGELLAALGALARLREVDELERRIGLLEAASHASS